MIHVSQLKMRQKQLKTLFLCFCASTVLGCATAPPEKTKLSDLPADSYDSLFPVFISNLQYELGHRPRVRFVGVTMEPRFGNYMENCLRKILSTSKKIYPPEIQGMYGKVQQTMAILPNGKIPLIGIEKTSGNNLLDQGLVYIIRQASPCEAFPEDIKSDTDLIVLTRTFTFTNTRALDFSEQEIFWKPKK